MRAELQNVRSLYNHVDSVTAYRSLAAQGLAGFIKLTQDALRMVTPECFPKAVPAFIFGDKNHGKKITFRYSEDEVDYCYDEVGTPIAELGSGDGRKLMVSWRGKDPADERRSTYTGPPAQVLDKKPRPQNCLFPKVGDEQGDRPPAISNIFYRQHDLEDGVSVVPMTSLLTSVNVLTQLSKRAVDEILNRDGLHMVPNIEQLVADKMADELPGGKVRTRVIGKDGKTEEYVDNRHSFTPSIQKCVFNVDHYMLVIAFSPRTLTAGGTKWTVMRSRKEQPILEEKPLRYGYHKDAALLPPFKLKWDGVPVMFDFSEERAMLHGLNYETELAIDDDYQCFIRAQLVCESIVVDGINHVFPFAVHLAGRKLIGQAVRDFMNKADIRIHGFIFHIPVLYDTLDGAVVAMAKTKYAGNRLVAEGVIGLGTGDEVAAKLIDTIDIRPCDPKTNHQMAQRTTPKLLQYIGPNDPEEHCAVKGLTPIGASPLHLDCPVVEYYIMDDMFAIGLLFKIIRTDKEKPNNIKRIVKLLPGPLHEGEQPTPRLVDKLTDDTLTILRQYGYKV